MITSNYKKLKTNPNFFLFVLSPKPQIKKNVAPGDNIIVRGTNKQTKQNRNSYLDRFDITI